MEMALPTTSVLSLPVPSRRRPSRPATMLPQRRCAAAAAQDGPSTLSDSQVAQLERVAEQVAERVAERVAARVFERFAERFWERYEERLTKVQAQKPEQRVHERSEPEEYTPHYVYLLAFAPLVAILWYSQVHLRSAQ